ncbi:hypothetical protein M513_05105 [Trichuris suis]|uniref:Uncharacterized protein n=1 Tax=Trichuris suis TaxID=68888 RepID=A0A085MA40_9BILA|nr:hypothetical protein M513_05105 [Trichuris suis]
MDTLRGTSICEECERADVERWLASDEEDRGLQTMDDEEILELISKEPAEAEEEPQYGDDEEEERPAAPSDNEAFRCAEVLMKWNSRQNQSYHTKATGKTVKKIQLVKQSFQHYGPDQLKSNKNRVRVRTCIFSVGGVKSLPPTAWPSGLRRQTQVKTCLPEAGLSVLRDAEKTKEEN